MKKEKLQQTVQKYKGSIEHKGYYYQQLFIIKGTTLKKWASSQKCTIFCYLYYFFLMTNIFLLHHIVSTVAPYKTCPLSFQNELPLDKEQNPKLLLWSLLNLSPLKSSLRQQSTYASSYSVTCFHYSSNNYPKT